VIERQDEFKNYPLYKMLSKHSEELKKLQSEADSKVPKEVLEV
jgi:hypothetical protein